MFLGIVATLLGLAPAGTALLAALLRAALGRPPGRLPLATLLGGGLPARGTSLGRHGSKDGRLRIRDKSENCTTGRHQTQKNHSKRNHEFATIIWQTAMETIHQIHRDHPTINGNEGMPTVHNSKKYM